MNETPFCPMCDEARPPNDHPHHHHGRICPVCGADLERRPRRLSRLVLADAAPPPVRAPRRPRTATPSSSSSSSSSNISGIASIASGTQVGGSGNGDEAVRSTTALSSTAMTAPQQQQHQQQEVNSREEVQGAAALAERSAGQLLLLERTLSDLRRQHRQLADVVAAPTSSSEGAAVDASLQAVTESLAGVRAELRRVFAALDGVFSSSLETGGDDDLVQRAVAASAFAGTGLTPAPASTGTAPAYLDRIPRVVLTPQSTVFAEATVTLNEGNNTTLTCRAVPGDFGVNHLAHRIANANIVYCGTGRGGEIDRQAMERIRCIVRASSSNLPPSAALEEERPTSPPPPPPPPPSLVLLFDRGGDVTFVRKGLMAQQVGAVAAIVANHVAEPWPYRMSDSSHEARKEPLQIPVVMIRKEDAQSILHCLREQPKESPSGGSCESVVTCDVEILPAGKSSECAVCLQPMQAGETIIVLPDCRHAFHDECATIWLRSHNTCPYCRSALPVAAEADPNGGGGGGGMEYRQRAGTNHGNLAGGSGSDDFYG